MSLTCIPKNPADEKKPVSQGSEGSGVTNITETLRKLDSAPSHANNEEGKAFRQIPVDLVEEESMESFPASDPPSHHKASK